MAPLNFEIKADGNPDKKFTKWHARVVETDEQFLVGYTVPFKDGDGNHKGLAQTRHLSDIPKLFYDRKTAAADFGLWAHYIWPTVVVESAGGHHLLVNTYDRARFTFGFYQLAAHTPLDNLILLFRGLLSLAKAPTYFPDLILKTGRVHRVIDGTTISLEQVTTVHRPNGKIEDQLVTFMTYLNPDTTGVGTTEALNTAKLMHWLLNDKEAVKASIHTAMEIMRGKAKRLAALHGLKGKRPELAIWASDITHQGRGNKDAIKAALAKPSFEAKLDALFRIGAPDFKERRESVRDHIDTLIEEKTFEGVGLGDAKLPLPA